MSAYQHELIDLTAVKSVQLAIIAHCELMGDRMAGVWARTDGTRGVHKAPPTRWCAARSRCRPG